MSDVCLGSTSILEAVFWFIHYPPILFFGSDFFSFGMNNLSWPSSGGHWTNWGWTQCRMYWGMGPPLVGVTPIFALSYIVIQSREEGSSILSHRIGPISNSPFLNLHSLDSFLSFQQHLLPLQQKGSRWYYKYRAKVMFFSPENQIVPRPFPLLFHSLKELWCELLISATGGAWWPEIRCYCWSDCHLI